MRCTTPLLILGLWLASLDSVYADAQMWVTSDTLNRRTCPSASCGVVGKLNFRESAVVYEERAGWARISRYYDGSCVEGFSAFVENGRNSCSAENGFVDGQFAEWVSTKYLAATRPADPGAETSGMEGLVAQSDDYRRHKIAFIKAAESLISSGRCTESDFEQMGGWMRSTSHEAEPIYFTYCGGMTVQNRIYLNASTNALFQ